MIMMMMIIIIMIIVTITIIIVITVFIVIYTHSLLISPTSASVVFQAFTAEEAETMIPPPLLSRGPSKQKLKQSSRLFSDWEALTHIPKPIPKPPLLDAKHFPP